MGFEENGTVDIWNIVGNGPTKAPNELTAFWNKDVVRYW